MAGLLFPLPVLDYFRQYGTLPPQGADPGGPTGNYGTFSDPQAIGTTLGPGATVQSKAGADFWDPYSRPESVPALFTPWDVVYLMGKPLPGVADVRGQRHQKIDRKSSPGSDFDTMTNLGTEPAIVTIKLRMWTPEQLADWQRWVPELEPRPGKPRKDPVKVHHPALAMHRITNLYVKTIGLVQRSGEPGVMEVTSQFYEWEPKLATGKNTPLKSRGSTDITRRPQALPAPKRPSETENKP